MAAMADEPRGRRAKAMQERTLDASRPGRRDAGSDGDGVGTRAKDRHPVKMWLIRGAVVVVALGLVAGAWQVAYARGKDEGRAEATSIRNEFLQARAGGPAATGGPAGGPGGAQSGGPGGQGGNRPGPGQGVNGTIEKVEGNVVTVATSDGSVKVTLGERNSDRQAGRRDPGRSEGGRSRAGHGRAEGRQGVHRQRRPGPGAGAGAIADRRITTKAGERGRRRPPDRTASGRSWTILAIGGRRVSRRCVRVGDDRTEGGLVGEDRRPVASSGGRCC